MKHSSILLTVFACACLLACQPQPESPTQAATTAGANMAADTLATLFAVPLEVAQADTANYDKLMRSIFNKVPIKSFTIRSADFLGAIGLPEDTKTPFDHVRIYMGMSSDSTFKLYLTPVVGAHLNPSDLTAGRDSILAITNYNKAKFGLDEDTQYMFDFSAPCPTTCPR